MAEELNLSDRTLDRLAERLARVQGNSAGRSANMGGGGGSSSGGDNKGPSAIGLATEALTAKFNPLSDATTAVKTAYGNLESVITPGLNTWRDLSKTGVNFGNDIVGMSAAASGTRMTLAEFGDVIKSNSGNFNGLGGNAAKGAENFAKLSKEMADSGVTDDLRMLGMTSKDINEVLAVQLAGQQTINMNDEASRKKAIASATALAFEMDQMSKLTGKSRSEQEEIMKKAQADMQAEAKLRLITMGKSEEEAAAIRDNYYKQQKEAELRGQGQMFKEVFATGTIQSEAAANQVAISGKEAEATMKAARASAVGDAQAATEASKEARLENSKNMKDVNKLQLATIGDGTAAGKTMMESMTANNAYYKAEQAVTLQLEREGKLKNLSADEKAKLIQEETIKQAQAAQTEKKPGSESTEALVKLGARADDAASAVMNGLVVPMNKDVGPALDKFNKGLLSNQMTDKTGKTTTKVQAAEKEVKEGYARGKEGKTVEGVNTLSDAAKKNQPGSFLENAASGAGEAIGIGMGSVLIPALDKIADKINPTKRAEGGIINNPELAIIGEAGKEYVVPEDKMQTLMQNVKLDGLQSAAKALSGGDKSASGGIDIGAMSKTISTTISSAQGPAGKQPSMADMSTSMSKMGMNDSQKKLFDDFNSLNAKQSEEKLASLKAEEESAKAANKAAMLARDAIEEKAELENRKLTESEEAQFKALGKELNSSYDRIRAAEDAQKVLSKVEENKKSQAIFASETVSKVMEDAGVKQLESVKKSTDEQSSLLTDYQKTTLKYAYTDTEGKQMQLENAKKLVESEKNVIADKNKQIEEIQASADGRELSNREKSRIERLQKEIEGSKETLSYREQDLEVYANIDKLKAETEIKAKTSATEATAEQVAAQAQSQKLFDEIYKEGAKAQIDSAKLVQAMKSDVLNEELAKANSAAAAMKEQMTKNAEAIVVKPKQNPADMFGGMFDDMFGGKGKELPPFMQKLNAQIKEIKPAEIKTPQTANKEGTKPTAANTSKPPETKPEVKKPDEKKDAKPAGTVEQVGLKDLHASLEHLNKSMAKLISYSEQTATAAQAQVKATKSLSGNKFAQ
jgi:hypothetical protein